MKMNDYNLTLRRAVMIGPLTKPDRIDVVIEGPVSELDDMIHALRTTSRIIRDRVEAEP